VTVAASPKPLQIEASPEETRVAVIPTWRRDLAVEADLAEEVARIAGYDAIPAILPHTPMPAYRHSPLEVRDRVREVLAGAGLTETVSHALVSPATADRFAWTTELPPVVGSEPPVGRRITVANPLSADHSVLRPALVGSLVEIVSTNLRRGRDDIAIFEIGKGYGRDGDTTREWWRLGIALTGAFEVPSWNRGRRPADLDDVKGVIELLARVLGFDPPAYDPLTNEPLLHPGRAARVVARQAGNITLAGVAGELQPAVAEEVELRGARVILAELDVAGLGAGRLTDVHVATPPRHPAAERDLAIVVRDEVPAAHVADAIRGAAGPGLASLELFDIYRGTSLGADEKSLAWRLVLRADDRTLTDAEIDATIAAITRAAAEIGGRIRT
jgi:phenylalanyl-tRNA synthetase beta chain